MGGSLTDGQRLAWDDIITTAVKVRDDLMDIGIAAYGGSICRSEDTCGDIDMIFTIEEQKGTPEYEDRLNQFNEWCEKHEITKNRQVRRGLINDIQVDIWHCDYDVWPAAANFVAGSAFFNAALRSLAKSKGWKLSQNGLFDENGNNMVAERKWQEREALFYSNCDLIETDKIIFDLLGIRYVPTIFRSAKSFGEARAKLRG